MPACQRGEMIIVCPLFLSSSSSYSTSKDVLKGQAKKKRGDVEHERRDVREVERSHYPK